MNKARWVSATAGAAMVAATLVLPAAGVAYASGNGNVTGNGNVGLLSGNTINAPVSVPVNLCGVSLGIIGFANSGCEGGASSNVSTDPSGGGNGGGGNSGNGNVVGNGNVGLISGNTITAPVSAPVNLCSISLALLGFSNSGCEGGATSNVTTATQGNNGNVTGIGNVGLGSGNTITAPISAPVNVCGVSAAVAGFANSGCKGGAEVNPPACEGDRCAPPSCHGDDCTPCEGQMCHCHGDHCTPCQGQMCHCHGDQCVCHGSQCACHGDHCTPPPGCQGSHCTPPGGCQGSHCTPPGNGGNPNGTNPGGTTTTVTNATMPTNGSLPTTGADLLLLGVAAVGTIGVGAGAVTLARHRRSGPAS